VVDAKAPEPRRPRRAGRKVFAPAAYCVRPDEDSVAREFLEAAKESNGSDDRGIPGGDGDDE
jgi:hypothetical protein